MIVYCVTNNLDNKKYVGQTGRTIEARWKEHLHSARQPSRIKQCPYLYAAMNKYGSENFTIVEIDRSENEDQIDDVEELWIAKLGTTDRSRGYNISFGGASRPHPDTRAKLSASLKGKPAWNKGRPMEEDHLKNTRLAAEKRRGVPLPITPQGRESLRQSKLGENNPNYGKTETYAALSEWRKKNPDFSSGNKNAMWRKDVSDSVILQLRSIGLKQDRIANIVGCSQGTVGNRIRKYPEYV